MRSRQYGADNPRSGFHPTESPSTTLPSWDRSQTVPLIVGSVPTECHRDMPPLLPCATTATSAALIRHGKGSPSEPVSSGRRTMSHSPQDCYGRMSSSNNRSPASNGKSVTSGHGLSNGGAITSSTCPSQPHSQHGDAVGAAALALRDSARPGEAEAGTRNRSVLSNGVPSVVSPCSTGRRRVAGRSGEGLAASAGGQVEGPIATPDNLLGGVSSLAVMAGSMAAASLASVVPDAGGGSDVTAREARPNLDLVTLKQEGIQEARNCSFEPEQECTLVQQPNLANSPLAAHPKPTEGAIHYAK